MAMNFLRKLAGSARAPVYVALGRNGAERAGALANDGRIQVVSSIRHAAILLVAGEIREADHPALRQLHDQMPHPRRTVWWGATPLPDATDPAEIAAEDDPTDLVALIWRQLLDRETESEADYLPDEPANEWRGKGDHGQGGKGMMGGTPYGRPLAMTGDDIRDGLALDSFTCEFGPFLDVLPPGLRLEITLQGDVIQSAKVRQPPYPVSDDDEEASRIRARLDTLAGGANGRGARLAFPPGLGAVGDTDIRDRHAGHLPGFEGDPPRLVDLLPGLEWNEAVLLMNSLPLSTLPAMCPVDQDERNEDEAGHDHHHMHHGGHG